MKSNHTKGNWRVGMENRLSIVCDSNDCKIPTIGYAETKSTCHEEAFANARIMAASKLMLETLVKCQEVLNIVINQTPTGELRNKLCDANIQVYAALIKATDDN